MYVLYILLTSIVFLWCDNSLTEITSHFARALLRTGKSLAAIDQQGEEHIYGVYVVYPWIKWIVLA